MLESSGHVRLWYEKKGNRKEEIGEGTCGRHVSWKRTTRMTNLSRGRPRCNAPRIIVCSQPPFPRYFPRSVVRKAEERPALTRYRATGVNVQSISRMTESSDKGGPGRGEKENENRSKRAITVGRPMSWNFSGPPRSCPGRLTTADKFPRDRSAFRSANSRPISPFCPGSTRTCYSSRPRAPLRGEKGERRERGGRERTSSFRRN